MEVLALLSSFLGIKCIDSIEWIRQSREREIKMDKKLRIGCHLSSSGGYLTMAEVAKRIGANTFQFFTRNPRGGAAKPVKLEEIAAFRAFLKENEIGPIMAHAPYTLNPCAAVPKTLEFAEMVLEDDIRRMELIPGNLYNFHPGSHVGQGIDRGIELVSSMLNRILRSDMKTTVLLETMSGKGSEVGGRFEELREIIDRIDCSEHIGVCLDTCHISDAGYDVAGDLDGVLEAFDRIVGLNRLKAVHLNDSKFPVGSKKDRHAPIGEGTLGLDVLKAVLNHPCLRDLPFYLETPLETEGHAKEIALLKGLYQKI